MKIVILIFLVCFCSLSSETIWQDNFEETLDWQLSGEFEINTPQGLGGEHGNPDPTSAYEGLRVLGIDLTGTGSYPGDYETSLGEDEYSAISPAINCDEFLNVELSFMLWLNVEQPDYDHASIDMSNDNGTTWIEVWTNTSGVENTSWGQVTYDISAVADLNEEVRIRFTVGPTDSSYQYSGWNIDDLIVSGDLVAYGAIEGNVVNSVTSEPVAFAQVNNQFGNTISDDEGYFILSNIPAGLRTLTINALGYYTYESEEFAVPENDTIYVLCEMEENPDAPSSPQNLEAEIYDENNVQLSWDAPATEEILLAYNVYRNGFLINSVLEESYDDLNLIAGMYGYFISAVYDVGESLPTEVVNAEITGVGIDQDQLINNGIKLSNYPNPFNPTTEIMFQISNFSAAGKIEIYNLKGQKVRQFSIFNHQSSITWNGDDDNGTPVSSGIYLYRLVAGNVDISRKCLLLK
jgi:Carboxypeptidase regulatory-like domain/FlgD Ig-like domain